MSWSMRAVIYGMKQRHVLSLPEVLGAQLPVRMMQTNFRKYANGGGFVEKELAASIVAAGPKMQSTANGTA